MRDENMKDTVEFKLSVSMKDTCTCRDWIERKARDLQLELAEIHWDVDVNVPRKLPPCPTHACRYCGERLRNPVEREDKYHRFCKEEEERD